jgi:hypothetical protein
MRSWEMELFDLRLAKAHRSKNEQPDYYPRRVFGVPGDAPTLSKRLWEADAIYFRSLRSILKSNDKECLRPLLALYCAYGFFVEAYHAVDKSEESGMLSESDARELRQSIQAWHRHGHYCFIQSIAWRSTMEKFSRLFRRIGRKLCGRKLDRWIVSP